MDAWAGFWISCAIVISTEMVLDYLKWRDIRVYDLKYEPKKDKWWKF